MSESSRSTTPPSVSDAPVDRDELAIGTRGRVTFLALLLLCVSGCSPYSDYESDGAVLARVSKLSECEIVVTQFRDKIKTMHAKIISPDCPK